MTVEIEQQGSHPQRRLAESFAAANNRLHARQQFRFVERLGDKVVGSKAKTLHLHLRPREPREDEDRRIVARNTHAAHNLESLDVREDQVENYDIVIIMLCEFETFLARIGMVDHGTG